MDDTTRHTIKIATETLRLLRLVAAQTGEKQYAVLARLLTKEWSRVQQDDPHRKDGSHARA
jgi:hypothetical protein